MLGQRQSALVLGCLVVGFVVAVAGETGATTHGTGTDGAVVLVKSADDVVASSVSGSFDIPLASSEHRVCCKALTASCMACSENIEVSEYCRLHPDTMGCAELQDAPIAPYTGPKFKATAEWQTVAEGQPIPSGLHVSVDMQTGAKQARLLPEDERPGILTVSESRAKKLGEIRSAIEAVDSDGDTTTTDDARMQSYVSHLRELKAKGLQVREDSEVLLNIIECLQQVRDDGAAGIECSVLGPDEAGGHNQSSDEMVMGLLESLGDLVHQVDNAVDVGKMGGYELVVGWISDTNTTTDVRGAAAVVLGAACSNNPAAQAEVAKAGALPQLTAQLQAAVGAGRNAEAKRMVHALGALVRQSPERVASLHAVGGLAALHDALTTAGISTPLGIKVVRLITDIARNGAGESDAPHSDSGADGEAAEQEEPVDASQAATAGALWLAESKFCDDALPLLQQCLPGALTGETDAAEAAVAYARALAEPCLSVGATDQAWHGSIVEAVRTVAAALSTYLIAAPDADHIVDLNAEVTATLVDLARFSLVGEPRSTGDL